MIWAPWVVSLAGPIRSISKTTFLNNSSWFFYHVEFFFLKVKVTKKIQKLHRGEFFFSIINDIWILWQEMLFWAASGCQTVRGAGEAASELRAAFTFPPQNWAIISTEARFSVSSVPTHTRLTFTHWRTALCYTMLARLNVWGQRIKSFLQLYYSILLKQRGFSR